MPAMKLPILIHPDPRLKKVCDPVPDLSDDLRVLAKDMLDTMYDAPGIGLAAPQVGVLSRLIVLDCVNKRKRLRVRLLCSTQKSWRLRMI